MLICKKKVIHQLISFSHACSVYVCMLLSVIECSVRCNQYSKFKTTPNNTVNSGPLMPNLHCKGGTEAMAFMGLYADCLMLLIGGINAFTQIQILVWLLCCITLNFEQPWLCADALTDNCGNLMNKVWNKCLQHLYTSTVCLCSGSLFTIS